MSYTTARNVQLPQYPIWVRDDEAIIFSHETGVFKTTLTAFGPAVAGWYRVRISARAYQTDQPLTMAVVAGQGVRRSFLTDTHHLGYFDALTGDEFDR